MIKTGKPLLPPHAARTLETATLILWVLILSFLTEKVSWAADIQVIASVDRQELTLEDSVNFSIIVEGTQSTPPPELPPLDAFSVRTQGSSSSIQIINGERSSSITYNFALLPRETGTFTIGPAKVEIEGKSYQTAPITLIIKEPSETAQLPKGVFAGWVVSNKKPYVHEQITATLRIYHRLGIRNLETNLQFPGFREESLKGPVQNTRMVNGIRYLSYEIPTALFPLRPGKVEIPEILIEFDEVVRDPHGGAFDPFSQGSIFDRFSRLKHKRLKTEAVTLDVQPLPQKNRPKNFSNLVGNFTISSQLSRTELEVGDTTTLTISVAGQGNIQDLVLASPQWGDDFKVYEDQPVFQPTDTKRTISGKKIYTYALIPLKSGLLQPPRITLNYFDPTKGNYAILQTQDLKLTVTPGNQTSRLKVVESPPDISPEGGNSVKKIGEDILPIHTEPELLENQGFSTQSALWYGAGLLLPPGLFFIYGRLYIRRERLKYDIAFSRSLGAYKQGQQKLYDLSPEADTQEVSRKLSLIVREYLGNILNLQGTAITSSEVSEKLRKNSFNEEKIQAVRKFLEKHERLGYAPDGDKPSEGWIEEALNLLALLEKK